MTMPGNPRRRHREHLFPSAKRPPARGQRGHRPFNPHPNDHADRATLGRQGRPRRPGMRNGSSDSGLARNATTCINASEGGPRPTLGPFERSGWWAWAHLQIPSGREIVTTPVRQSSIQASPTLNCDGFVKPSSLGAFVLATCDGAMYQRLSASSAGNPCDVAMSCVWSIVTTRPLPPYSPIRARICRTRSSRPILLRTRKRLSGKSTTPGSSARALA